MTEVRNECFSWAWRKVGRRRAPSSFFPLTCGYLLGHSPAETQDGKCFSLCWCFSVYQEHKNEWKLKQLLGTDFVKAKSGDSISGWAKPKQRCSCLRVHSWKLQVFLFSILSSPKPLSLAYFHKDEKTDLRKWRAEPKALCWKPTISPQNKYWHFWI